MFVISSLSTFYAILCVFQNYSKIEWNDTQIAYTTKNRLCTRFLYRSDALAFTITNTLGQSTHTSSNADAFARNRNNWLTHNGEQEIDWSEWVSEWVALLSNKHIHTSSESIDISRFVFVMRHLMYSKSKKTKWKTHWYRPVRRKKVRKEGIDFSENDCQTMIRKG